MPAKRHGASDTERAVGVVLVEGYFSFPLGYRTKLPKLGNDTVRAGLTNIPLETLERPHSTRSRRPSHWDGGFDLLSAVLETQY